MNKVEKKEEGVEHAQTYGWVPVHTPENAHTHVLVHGISGPAEKEGKEVVRRTRWEHGGNTGHNYFKSVTPSHYFEIFSSVSLG